MILCQYQCAACHGLCREGCKPSVVVRKEAVSIAKNSSVVFRRESVSARKIDVTLNIATNPFSMNNSMNKSMNNAFELLLNQFCKDRRYTYT